MYFMYIISRITLNIFICLARNLAGAALLASASSVSILRIAHAKLVAAFGELNAHLVFGNRNG